MENLPPRGEGAPEPPEPYEAPAVVWEEPYDPVGLTVSCALTFGSPSDCDLLYMTPH